MTATELLQLDEIPPAVAPLEERSIRFRHLRQHLVSRSFAQKGAGAEGDWRGHSED